LKALTIMSIRFQLILVGIIIAAQLPQSASAQNVPNLDQMMQAERQDLGVPPTRQLHDGAMHGATPASIPGGQVITTKGLVALVQGRQAPFVLFDVLGQRETLPNAVPAVWLSQPGSFDDSVQQQASQMLAQQTRGRKDMALVFYCLSRECWLSYNASLRAIAAGYTNVLWYRGGIEAWKSAGLAAQPQGQPGWAQPGQQPQPQQQQATDTPPKFVPIKPVVREGTSGARPAGELRVGQGRFFSFVQPPGWRIGEDGQFALTQVAPDTQALTLMVGNAGLPMNQSSARFAFEKLSVMQPQNLQMGPARQARPASGFGHAVEFDVSYSLRGVAWRGVAKVSVAPAYDSATMALTAALSTADQWGGYATWLPSVADQLSATNGAAFGMRGIMQQNLQNSVAFGESARQYRDWSQKNWQQVTDGRNASQDRQNFARRENLAGVQTFANPYGGGPAVELPTTQKYFWADRQGNTVGTNDPSANPNTGSTVEWRKMERVNQ